MGIFDWFKRKKYYYSLSKEERERDKKRRECHGHLFVEVKGGGKKGGEPYPNEIYLECSKCGFGHYKSTLTKEELKENRFPKPIKNWNEPRKREDLDFTLTNSKSKLCTECGASIDRENIKICSSCESLLAKEAIEEIKLATILQSTSLANKINVEWVNGLEVFDGSEALKRGDDLLFKDGEYQLNNVPLYWKSEDNAPDYIFITNQVSVFSEKIIDSIIEKNGGKENFKFLGDLNGYHYTFQGEKFVIGYLSKAHCVRLNHVESK